MRFKNRSHPLFRSVSLGATLGGLIYLVSRFFDFHLYYRFMVRRHSFAFWSPHWFFPFVPLAVDLIFVSEQLFFSLINWKSRVPEKEGTPKLAAGDLPFVSVLIPSYNEPLEVIEPVVRAAAKIRYPAHQYEILFLDDGGEDVKAELIKKLAAEYPGIQIRYESRIKESKTRAGYKAGNLNFGISKANPETRFFLLLDSDQVCLPDILLDLIPYTTSDAKIRSGFGFVQAPQTYQIGPSDSWDRPCREFHTVTQSYRAYWNAVMLTGTSALISAEALRRVGNFDETTVTEDVMTGLKIHGQGFEGFYHPNPVAYGLVPETLHGILSQRLRWAQGSFQLLKVWSKVTKGLSRSQKLAYFSGIIYFLMGFPYLLLALLPPLILIFHLDGSLHYSSRSLVLLGVFILIRYLAREAYCPKKWIERSAGNYLNLIYAPVFIYALFASLIKKSISFDTTPKVKTASPKSFKDRSLRWTPPLVATLNLIAAARILYLGFLCGYPWKDFLLDYGGIVGLAFYFAVCGFASLGPMLNQGVIAN